jgi:aspartyl/asparaginyl beta-hydroxylase (cupin superfamily)
MFYDTSYFSFVKKLEDKWKDIFTEYQSLKTGIFPYEQTDLYQGEWDVFPFVFFGKIFLDNCKMCPVTWDLLCQIPGITTASFSILRSSTEISPHTGFTKKVIRCHLALEVPNQCAIIVGNESRLWKKGKCLFFDDTVEHSAYNRSAQDRVVLLLDIDRNETIN